VLNHRIQKLSSDGRFLAAWGARGTDGGQFRVEPRGLFFDAAGTVWTTVAGGGIVQIQRFDADGRFLMSWGNRDDEEAFDLEGVEQGLCVLPSGQVYVADTGHHRIRSFALSHSATPRTLGHD
ncbi:NHL repeat-containing protein, partial [Candidatus Latescibacterota bacterium]